MIWKHPPSLQWLLLGHQSRTGPMLCLLGHNPRKQNLYIYQLPEIRKELKSNF